jgi:hypothetical protein
MKVDKAIVCQKQASLGGNIVIMIKMMTEMQF